MAGNTSGHSPDFVLTVDTTVAPVTIYDGSTVLGTAVADEDGHWRFTPDPLGGEHRLSTTVTDVRGTPAATRRTLCSRWTPPWRRSATCR
ncbi:hypothetical protein KZ657_16870 [Klebsiella pneumoniae]|nr:Ig-like domain-containing protein [Klebsiella pneumoniae]UAA17982.1 hypothetical protein KZ657_16870 [Klebsiella pneumoniae]